MKTFKIFISVFLFLVIYWYLMPFHNPVSEIKTGIPPAPVDSIISAAFSVVGDIMCHSTQYHYAAVKKDSFDFNPVFRVIKNYLSKADITMGNLETVLAGKEKRYSGYPFFNTPDEFLRALKYAGFDLLFTANNHSNDMGQDGAERTIRKIRDNELKFVGTESSDPSLSQDNLIEINGLKFAVFAYTYSTNYNPADLHPKKFVNHIDTLLIKQDIDSAKTSDPDAVIVYFHFGTEYLPNISLYQREIVQKTINYGADIILASHPHIIQPFERYKTENGNIDSGFVTFSLGNFLSNQRWRYSDGGLIFNFSISKNITRDSVFIENVNFLPVWVFKGKTDLGKEYIIVPSSYYNRNEFEFLSEADIDSMKKSYYDTIDLFTKKSKYPKVDLF